MSAEPLRMCPDAETLALFAEGRLSANERAGLIEHLDTCEDCMAEVALAMRAAAGPPATRTFRLTPRMAAAAAALLVGVLTPLLWPYVDRQRDPMARLVALAPRAERTVEPRLTGGFAWAAYAGQPRAGDDDTSAERMKLVGAAGELAERAERTAAADAQHAAGVAMLLAQKPAAAIRHLEQAARKTNAAKTWSDLAAARYAAAAALQRPSLYPEALAAADVALRIDPALPEALFNRALVLERMRLSGEARRAWLRYLEVDPSSPWAAEARARLADLPAVTSTSRFERERPRLEDAAARGDVAAVQEIVARHPDRARAFAEAEYLGLWGEAVRSGDAAGAARFLTMARTIGDVLARTRGESLPRDAVAAIDRAAEPQRRRLAEAHALYRRARLAYSRHDIVAARRGLMEAAAELEAAGSPAALAARYYAAGARLASNDTRGARQELEAVLAAVDGNAAFAALRGRVRWELGRAYLLEDDQRRGIPVLRDAAALLRRAGDRLSEGFVESLVARTLLLTGRGDDGWEARLRAFGALGAEGDPALLTAVVADAMRTELLAGRRETALALARLEPPSERAGARVVDVVDALVNRALLEATAGDGAAAVASVREAQAVANRITDPALRAREEAEIAVAAGAALAGSDPRAAMASLTRAIDFFRGHGLPFSLAEPLLLRARCALRAGDAGAAQRDLDEGVRLVERHRTSGAAALLGTGTLDAGRALFEESIRLALDRGDTGRAFALAERARGGSIELVELQRRLAGSATSVLVPVVLPDEVITFAVSEHELAVGRRGRDRASLAALVEDALSEGGTSAADALYDDLVRPVEAVALAAGMLIVVPHDVLETAPFAALRDRATGRHLVERLPVAMARSATSLQRVAPPAASPRTLAAVALPSGEESGTGGLPAAEEELEEIVAYYRRASRPPATFAALRAADADVIHVAGHTARRPGGGEQALVFGAGATVSWKEIAASPVHAGVVVLAACETLRPPASPLTRAPSLAAAFSAAGASEVIGTLAPIGDRDARVLFRAVHRELAAGAGAAAAVRAAQLQAIRNRGPRSWRTVALLTRRVAAASASQGGLSWAR